MFLDLAPERVALATHLYLGEESLLNKLLKKCLLVPYPTIFHRFLLEGSLYRFLFAGCYPRGRTLKILRWHTSCPITLNTKLFPIHFHRCLHYHTYLRNIIKLKKFNVTIVCKDVNKATNREQLITIIILLA